MRRSLSVSIRRTVLIRVMLVAAVLLPFVVHTQHAPAAVVPSAGLGAVGAASGPAAILNTYDAYFVEASARYAFPANLIKAVAWIEGGWAGTSPSGAVGIMQVMPIHWGALARNLGYDIYTPRGNILMGTYILNHNLKTYGSYEMAVRRYLGVGVDPVTGISDTLYWSMVRAKWQELNAAPGLHPVVNTDEQGDSSLRGADPYRARDGLLTSTWYVSGTPPSAILQIDLGQAIRVSSIWWTFRITGAADSFAVRVSLDGRTWQTVGRFGNAPAKSWRSVTANRDARYVRLQFSNPNADPVIGYVAELEVYGSRPTVPTATPSPTVRTSPTATARPPACTASPNAARYLTKVTIACTRFAAGERVYLHWGAASTRILGSFTADHTGAGSGTLKIPEAPGGAHVVVAKGDTSGKSVNIPVTVKSRAALSASSGTSGRRITFTLTGFRSGELVDIRWFVTATTSTVIAQDLVASPRGTVAFTFNVPASTPGSHKVEGSGGLGSRASATFTVTGATPSGTATATRTPVPTRTPTATRTPSPTLTPASSATSTPTIEPTATLEPTIEPTATSTPTIEPTATLEPTLEPTATPTETPAAPEAVSEPDAFESEAAGADPPPEE